MGKAKKEHRKKVAKRNEMLKSKESKSKKEYLEILQRMVQEQKMGKFENNEDISLNTLSEDIIVDTNIVDVESSDVDDTQEKLDLDGPII